MLNIAGIEWRQNINKCVNAPMKAPIFALEFCRQGRIEWASGILPCNHLESGEMLICNPWALSSLKRSQDYKGELICHDLRLDLIIDNQLILELKSVVDYRKLFEKQLLTYLRLMNCEMGYVVNFNSEDIRHSIYPVINSHFIKL